MAGAPRPRWVCLRDSFGQSQFHGAHPDIARVWTAGAAEVVKQSSIIMRQRPQSIVSTPECMSADGHSNCFSCSGSDDNARVHGHSEVEPACTRASPQATRRK